MRGKKYLIIDKKNTSLSKYFLRWEIISRGFKIVLLTFLYFRLTPGERRRMMGFMDKHEIDPKKVHSSGVKNTTKMSIISMARDLSTYFSRVYPVSSTDQDVEVQYLAVTHTGLKLLRREKSLPTDFLNVSFK